MIDDLISRLRAPATITLTGQPWSYVNPDGPEAAEALILLRDALTDLADAGAEAWGEDRPCVRFAREILTTTKIEKAEEHD